MNVSLKVHSNRICLNISVSPDHDDIYLHIIAGYSNPLQISKSNQDNTALYEIKNNLSVGKTEIFATTDSKILCNNEYQKSTQIIDNLIILQIPYFIMFGKAIFNITFLNHLDCSLNMKSISHSKCELFKSICKSDYYNFNKNNVYKINIPHKLYVSPITLRNNRITNILNRQQIEKDKLKQLDLNSTKDTVMPKKKNKKKKKKHKGKHKRKDPTSVDTEMELLDSILEKKKQITIMNSVFLAWKTLYFSNKGKYLIQFNLSTIPVYLTGFSKISYLFRCLKFHISLYSEIYSCFEKIQPSLFSNTLFLDTYQDFYNNDKTINKILNKMHKSYKFLDINITKYIKKISNFIINENSNASHIDFIVKYIFLCKSFEYNKLIENINIYQDKHIFSHYLYLLYKNSQYVDGLILTEHIMTMACMIDRIIIDIIYLNLSISKMIYKEMELNLSYLNLFSNIHFENQFKTIDTLISSTLEKNKHKYASIFVDMQIQISNEECYAYWSTSFIKKKIHKSTKYILLKDIDLNKVLIPQSNLRFKTMYYWNPFLKLYDCLISSKEPCTNLDFDKELYLKVLTLYNKVTSLQYSVSIRLKYENKFDKAKIIQNKILINNGFPIDIDLKDIQIIKCQLLKLLKFNYCEYISIYVIHLFDDYTSISNLINSLKLLNYNIITTNNSLLNFVTGNNLIDYINIINKYYRNEYSLCDVAKILFNYKKFHLKKNLKKENLNLLIVNNVELRILKDLSTNFPLLIYKSLINFKIKQITKIRYMIYAYIWKQINFEIIPFQTVINYINPELDIENLVEDMQDYLDKPSGELFIYPIFMKMFLK